MGMVEIDGYKLPGQAAAVRRRLGVVMHQPLLYGDLTAEENLIFYGRMYGMANFDDRISEILELVGLAARRRDLVRTFSRGMQQRLSIGRAIIHDPNVILFDEPYTGLDQDAAAMLDDVLRKVFEQGKTIVMTSHDLVRIADLATRYAILSRGVVADTATREAVGPQNLLNYYREVIHAS
jgi:heme exporter protein A